MKLIIAGTRPPDYIVKNVKKYAEWMILLFNSVSDRGISYGTFSSVDDDEREIVSGGAYGTDHAGEIIARMMMLEENVKLTVFNADWKTHGKSAGMIRNREMADYADELLLVWDGKSAGSRNMKEEMVKRGKPVHELVIEDWTLGVK